MIKITPERIALAEERRKRAQYRRDQTANRLYELMGWGYTTEIRSAERLMERANKELQLAEENLEKLLKKQKQEAGESQP